MDCASVHRKLADYLDGVLPGSERQTVDAHLAACAACRAEYALLQEVDEAMATWPVLAEPEGLAGRVMEAIGAGEASETATRAQPQWSLDGQQQIRRHVRLHWQDALLGLALALTVAVLVLSVRYAWTTDLVESMALDLQVQHSLSTIERAVLRARYAARAEIKRDWVDISHVFGWVSSGIVLLAGAAAAIVLIVQWPGETLASLWNRRTGI